MRFIILDDNNKVIRTREGIEPKNNEIPSENGKLGQIMQPDGTFIDPEPKPYQPEPHQPTNAEIAQMISGLQADLEIAGVIE